MYRKLTCAGMLALAGQVAAADTASLVVYQVEEEPGGRYISRVLVTDDWVRIDEGARSDGYTLLDRGSQRIYNVSHRDRSVLELPPGVEPGAVPQELQLTERLTPQPKSPSISGVSPVRLELLAQDEVCRDLQVAPGLAPNATAGLREFYQALARVDAQMIAGMPADTQQPCDLAYGVYAAGAPFAQGLPVAEVRAKRKQMMVDLEPEFAVEPSLFTLPEGYRRITMGAF